MKFDVNFYKQSNGFCPVLNFLDFLDDFELRAKQGTNIMRVLYFFVIVHKIILTNGFVYKSQKTPKSEIGLAKRYRRDYLKIEKEA